MVVSTQQPKQIVKRDGSAVVFESFKITEALKKCFQSVGKSPSCGLEEVTKRVCNVVYAKYKGGVPTVENVQDAVEYILQADGEFEAAKHYILFRDERRRLREDRPVPQDVKDAFKLDEQYFPTTIQAFQFYDKYSRFDYSIGRRETWVETVDRAVDFLYELAGERLDISIYERIRLGILNHKVMPSMRLLAMAGDPARRDNTTIYNCSYLPVDSLESFVEGLLISMAGCGVGFSVEEENVGKLPVIKRQKHNKYPTIYVVEDTAEGWAYILRTALHKWFDGDDLQFDFSQIRPAGSILYTKGGRASGPEPLIKLLAFTKKTIFSRQGRRLRTIDAHDIMCAVGSAAVAGGVRRTAMISLFDEDDHLMMTAKSGNIAQDAPQRWNANNSMVWSTTNEITFIERFHQMIKDGRGEPGIFNREVARATMPKRRNKNWQFGTNPCGEIILRPRQFCNLSAVINRKGDNFDVLKDKIELATIIGTIQSMATYFPNLSDEWRKNCEDERLLGVDITGQLDHTFELRRTFNQLREYALETNAEIANSLGINQSAAITCVKPSGNTSILVNCSSGLHARWAPYYLKNARVSIESPLYKVMKDAGVPMTPENGEDGKHTMVVHFPIKSPEGAVTRNDRSAVEQCEWWAVNKNDWTEHNPSVTITYKPDEVIELMQWVHNNLNIIGGMSFFPAFDGKYDLLPLVEITEEEYNRRIAEFPIVDWSKIYQYEIDDQTKAAQELACMAGICELEV